MNDRNNIDGRAFDEQRWQAQERARIAAREGRNDADADDLRIARALRRAAAADLPVDFAAQVARMARAQAEVDAVFEQRLLRGLGIVFGLSAAATVAWFGRGWADAFASVLPGGNDAVGWGSAVALCLLANWSWGAFRRYNAR